MPAARGGAKKIAEDSGGGWSVEIFRQPAVSDPQNAGQAALGRCASCPAHGRHDVGDLVPSGLRRCLYCRVEPFADAAALSGARSTANSEAHHGESKSWACSLRQGLGRRGEKHLFTTQKAVRTANDMEGRGWSLRIPSGALWRRRCSEGTGRLAHAGAQRRVTPRCRQASSMGGRTAGDHRARKYYESDEVHLAHRPHAHAVRDAGQRRSLAAPAETCRGLARRLDEAALLSAPTSPTATASCRSSCRRTARPSSSRTGVLPQDAARGGLTAVARRLRRARAVLPAGKAGRQAGRAAEPSSYRRAAFRRSHGTQDGQRAPSPSRTWPARPRCRSETVRGPSTGRARSATKPAQA